MASDYPLKIFYDASCPVCALEMDQLRARDAAGRLELVDMSAPRVRRGLPRLRPRRPRGRDPRGATRRHGVRGMPVLRLAYAAAGLGWLVRPTGFARCALCSTPATGSSPATASRSPARSRRRSPPCAPGGRGGATHERPGLRCHRMHRPRGRPARCAGAATTSSRRVAAP